MRKCRAIATYKDNWIYNLTLITSNGDYINPITYDPVDVAHPYINRSYKGMLDSIVGIAKNNGYQVEKRKMFDTDFIGEIQKRRSHDVNTDVDLTNILHILQEDDFLTENGKPRYKSVSFEFYVK